MLNKNYFIIILFIWALYCSSACAQDSEPNSILYNKLQSIPTVVDIKQTRPNTTFFKESYEIMFEQPLDHQNPDGEKFPHHLGRYEFSAHGSSPKGPNTSSIYTHHAIVTTFKTSKPGSLIAVALCNIHGLWESSKKIQIR